MAFPESPLLVEAFDNPPNEDPLSQGGAWAQATAQPPLRALGGVATDSVHGATNYSYYTEAFGAMPANEYMEAWGCRGGGGLGAALETHRVALWKNPPSVEGYLVYFGGGIGDETVIRKYEGSVGAFTDLAQGGGGGGDQMGIAINGDTIESWSGGPFAWTMNLSVVDTSISRSGIWYGALGVEDPSGGGLSWTCFGGGVIRRRMPQIYRRPNE